MAHLLHAGNFSLNYQDPSIRGMRAISNLAEAIDTLLSRTHESVHNITSHELNMWGGRSIQGQIDGIHFKDNKGSEFTFTNQRELLHDRVASKDKRVGSTSLLLESDVGIIKVPFGDISIIRKTAELSVKEILLLAQFMESSRQNAIANLPTSLKNFSFRPNSPGVSTKLTFY